MVPTPDLRSHFVSRCLIFNLIIIQVVSLNEETAFDGSIAHESKDNDVQIRVFPDTSIFRSKSSNSIKVVFAVYDGDELFPNADENLHIESVSEVAYRVLYDLLQLIERMAYGSSATS